MSCLVMKGGLRVADVEVGRTQLSEHKRIKLIVVSDHEEHARRADELPGWLARGHEVVVGH